MYSLAIFDLDGTLLDTLDDLYLSVCYALKVHGFPERSRDEVRRFIGNGVKKLMERATPPGTDSETNAKCLETFRAYYLKHMSDNTSPFPGVLSTLEEIKSEGVKIAVVSNKLHEAVKGLCDDYFPGLIDQAIGVTREEERKPSPINVIKAMESFSCSKDETIYIGDSEVDVETAHNAGLKCIGVTWGFRDEKTLITAGCDVIVAQPEELIKALSGC